MGQTVLTVLPILGIVVVIVATLLFFASRYRRCPSDQILVVYGKIKGEGSAKCIHGGGTFVWPLIQECQFLPLTPMTIGIDLKNALSMQNIRIDVPSAFTVGISTNESIMGNAAERLLGLGQKAMEEMAGEIIFGQLRLTVASMTIEEINKDREKFLEEVRKNVEPELEKIGLYLINVNITDITDESGYIRAIGQKAAATAINQANIDVAEEDKKGAIGTAEADKEKEINVANAHAESAKGQKKAESSQRIVVQQQEALAIKGEADAHADAAKGQKTAEADQRVHVQQKEAEAIEGENIAKATIAEAEAGLGADPSPRLRAQPL